MAKWTCASLVLLGLLASTWADQPSCASADQASCGEDEDSSMLMLKAKPHLQKGEYRPRNIRGKSLYFIVADYFAGPPADQPVPANCDGQTWCNGTIRGITSKLDYIQGMGFEGIWVTPLIEQVYWDPDDRSGYGQYGYWAKDWYKIDPNYGTEEDLKELSRELHKRDMVFVYDIVLNHVGPVHDEETLATFNPFNKPEYLHRLGIGNMTFNEYAQGYAYNGTGYPPPVQGLGPGAMCIAGPSGGCENYHCPVDPAFGNPCPSMPTYYGDEAPGPKDIPNCGVGDLVCEGYKEEQTIEGWFYDLGDLNHSHPFVHDELIKWGMYMRDTYHIDGFRLDTAPYVSKDFLADFQAAVRIPILGEVTASNWTFFKSYAPKPKAEEGPVLKGLLNFYLQNVATPGFCGIPAFFPGANLDLRSLAANIEQEYGLSKHGVNDHDLLGNFVDNHDMARLDLYCKGVMSRIKNALAWTMLAQGIPIIFYGTEKFYKTTHPAMWNTGYPTNTSGYTYIRNLNVARKELSLHTAPMKVEAADANHLVFSRRVLFTKKSSRGVFVFLNNFDDDVTAVTYEAGFLPVARKGWIWVDALHGYRAAKIVKGKFLAPSNEPAALVLKSRLWMFQKKVKVLTK